MKFLIFFTVFLSLFLFSCNMTTFKNYAYKKIQKEYEWGYLNAKMIGKDIKLENGESLRGKFYELLIWISLKNGYADFPRYAVLNSVILFDEEKKKNAFNAKSLKSDFSLSSNNTYDADFIFKSMPLEYHDYELNINFHFVISENDIKEQISLKAKFIRNYTEEQISFWDKLMGI